MNNIVQIALDKIHPYENNPRYNDDAVDAIAESISLFGFLNPLIVTSDFTIINGHTRYKAAQKLKLPEVPCIIADHLSADEIKAYRIADNKTSENATWDYENLVIEIKELKEASFDINSLGFANELLEDLLYYSDEDIIWDGETNPDQVPNNNENTQSELGKRYQLGTHILQVGGSTYTLMADKKANVYATEWESNEKTDDASAFVDGVFYIVADDNKLLDIHDSCESNNWDVHEKLLWVASGTDNAHTYRIDNRSVFYGWGKSATHRWFNDRKQSNVLEYQNQLTDFIPVEMWVYLIRNSSQRGELVLDNGSSDGGVLIACEQTGRVCRMIAKGVAEADIIRKRWAEFTYGEGCDWVLLTGEIK